MQGPRHTPPGGTGQGSSRSPPSAQDGVSLVLFCAGVTQACARGGAQFAVLLPRRPEIRVTVRSGAGGVLPVEV